MEEKRGSKSSRDGRGTEQGGEGEGKGEGMGGGDGSWQVDYGRRSRCLEMVGTRAARLLGDRHDAMTSSV